MTTSRTATRTSDHDAGEMDQGYTDMAPAGIPAGPLAPRTVTA